MTNPPLAVDLSVEHGLGLEEGIAAQERLLRAGRAAVHVATLRDAALSYGVGVDDRAPYLDRARADRVPVVRRPSGGSGLVHLPGDLLWAVVLPRTDRRVGRDFLRAYDRLGRGLVDLLAARRVAARWIAPPGLSEGYCPLSSRGQVLESGGRVLAAAAQHATSSTLLHSGALPRTLDRGQIARWFELPSPGPADALTCLTEVGLLDPPEEMARSLGRHLVAALERQGAP